MITLRRVERDECERIYHMQIVDFKDLLDRYRDFETNPGAETLGRVEKRFGYPGVEHYFIVLYDEDIGYVRIHRLEGQVCRLSQMVVLPRYQGNGYAQQALKQVEGLNPQVRCWVLDTIRQEPKLCHLYEKMGYRLTGAQVNVKEGMDLVDFEKWV